MSGRGIPPEAVENPLRRASIRSSGGASMTAEEAAGRIGVAVQTIRRWVEQGRMVPRPAAGVLRIPSSEVERCRRWMDGLRRRRLAREATGPRRQTGYPVRCLKHDQAGAKITAVDAASWIGCDQQTLRRWTAERRILAFPGVVNRNGLTLYGYSQVDRAERYVDGLMRDFRKGTRLMKPDGTDTEGTEDMEGTR